MFENTDLKRIRARLPNYLSPEIGASAGMTLPQLQQLIAFRFWPSESQITALARRLRIERTDQ
jgi:hypothetical protein